MAKKSKKTYEIIVDEATKILKTHPEGLIFKELVTRIGKKYPKIKRAVLSYTVSTLDQIPPNQIDKPSRGLFRLVEFRGYEEKVKEEKVKRNEKPFYQPVADLLVGELWECDRAFVMGSSVSKKKWDNPDVLGITMSRMDDIAPSPVEVVSAEVKDVLSTSELITGFGQACCYQLFSHKVYLVIPKPREDNIREEKAIQRIDSLCCIFGIGLVLFDNTSAKVPKFEVRVRANRLEPDNFYLNEALKKYKAKLFLDQYHTSS